MNIKRYNGGVSDNEFFLRHHIIKLKIKVTFDFHKNLERF